VAECMFAVENHGGMCGVTSSGKIKEHFGVEDQVKDSNQGHTCPFKEEINDDYETLCDCDPEQTRQCAMDI